MEPYFMETERLGFSLWCEDDIESARALWGDPAVTQYISGTGVFSEQQIRERLHNEIATQKMYGLQYWPVYNKAGHTFAGCCGLRPYDSDKKIYELGFHLKSDCWGKGIGTEAALAVIEYAYGKLGANGLFAGHNPNNRTPAKILSKLGFVYSHDAFYAPTGLQHPSYFHFR